jgi:hypothetical protein
MSSLLRARAVSLAFATARAVPHRSSAGPSAGAIVIAVVAATVLAGCLLWALARNRGYEPEWWLSLRHAVAEAGFRASSTWAEFSDWLRLGR